MSIISKKGIRRHGLSSQGQAPENSSSVLSALPPLLVLRSMKVSLAPELPSFFSRQGASIQLTNVAGILLFFFQVLHLVDPFLEPSLSLNLLSSTVEFLFLLSFADFLLAV